MTNVLEGDWQARIILLLLAVIATLVFSKHVLANGGLDNG